LDEFVIKYRCGKICTLKKKGKGRVVILGVFFGLFILSLVGLILVMKSYSATVVSKIVVVALTIAFAFLSGKSAYDLWVKPKTVAVVTDVNVSQPTVVVEATAKVVKQPTVATKQEVATVVATAVPLATKVVVEEVTAIEEIVETPELRLMGDVVVVSIIYAPEYKDFMEKIIPAFNQLYEQGINPISRKPLEQGEARIVIEGKTGSSGTVTQGIMNAIVAPNNSNVETPVVFIPSSGLWFKLGNYQLGQNLFPEDSPSTGNAPIVIAIWKDRLDAIRAKNPGVEIGLREIRAVNESPNGWADYGIAGPKNVLAGRTDPRISTTAMDYSLLEFMQSANDLGLGEILSLEIVNNLEVQAEVQKYESLMKHYDKITTRFKEYFARDPNELHFLALELNDVMAILEGKTQFTPNQALSILFPSGATFVHDHPFGILNASWVSDDQKTAGQIFLQYLLSEEVQTQIMQYNFMPVSPDIALETPFTEELFGFNPELLKNIKTLQLPNGEILSAVQASWPEYKRNSDLVLLVDISGSMNNPISTESKVTKLDQAKLALKAFLATQDGRNNIGLTTFNTVYENNEEVVNINPVVPLGSLETNRGVLDQAIDNLSAVGNTPMYDGMETVISELVARNEPEKFNVVLLFTDGANNKSKATLNSVLTLIANSRNNKTPVLVVPIAYGADADVGVLLQIGKASGIAVQSGNPEDIISVFETISSFF
jgi:Ca-activated chloride channel family protein